MRYQSTSSLSDCPLRANYMKRYHTFIGLFAKEHGNMNNYKETPLWQETLPLDERIDYVINEMTLEEKIQCMTPGIIDIPRLHIKAFHFGGEAAHGIEARHDMEYSPGEPVHTTDFPQPIGLSQTWDTELLEQVGEAVGNEGRIVYQKEQNGGLSRWAPTIDMARDPRWGRTEECYGEDPYLTGTLSSSYIQGLQGRDPFYLRVGATLKHFYANNMETDRICTSSSIDPRNKNDYYLEPFYRAITKGHAESLMTAYNEINGIPAMLNKEVQTLVKDTWGLRGHVVTDGLDVNQTVNNHHFFSTHEETIKYGLLAGIDCFTDDTDYIRDTVKSALDKQLITEEDLNKALRRQFSTRIRLGLYDADSSKNPYAHVDESLLGSKQHASLALKAAEESLVLLKNDNNMLPLAFPDKNKKIAVVGPLSDVWNKDWYGGLPMEEVTILDGLKELCPDYAFLHDNSLNHVKLHIGNGYVGIDENNNAILTVNEKATVFIHTDWGNNNHTFVCRDTGNYLKAPVSGGVISATKNEAFGWYITESFHIKHSNSGCTFFSWNNMPITVTKEGFLTADESAETGLFVTMELIKDHVASSVSLAKEANTVIVCLGCHPMINSKEEVDRPDILLPESQQTLLEQLYKVNKNIILILTANYPYAIDWAKAHIPAILLTPTGAQCLGRAVANAIFGVISPSGRLSMTWYKKDTLLPPMTDYDIIKSKRTYQYYDEEVLYPFGHGLSYGTFRYHDLQIHKETDALQVQCTVTRSDAGFSSEHDICDDVVELYVTKPALRTNCPLRQLKAFTRIPLAPSNSQKVTFTIPYEDLSSYDTILSRKRLVPGDYTFFIGSSSLSVNLEATCYLDGEDSCFRNPYEMTLATHYDDYDNAMIYRGYGEFEAVYPRNSALSTTLVFQDFAFNSLPTSLFLEANVFTTTFVTVTLGGFVIATQILPCKDGFHFFRLPFSKGSIPRNSTATLTISFVGNLACTRLYFK